MFKMANISQGLHCQNWPKSCFNNFDRNDGTLLPTTRLKLRRLWIINNAAKTDGDGRRSLWQNKCTSSSDEPTVPEKKGEGDPDYFLEALQVWLVMWSTSEHSKVLQSTYESADAKHFFLFCTECKYWSSGKLFVMGGLLWGVARRRKPRWIITLSIYGYSAVYSERGGTKPAPWILNIRYRDPVPVIAWDQCGKVKPNARKKITIDIGVPVIQSRAVSRIHRNEKHVTHNYWYTDKNAMIQ